MQRQAVLLLTPAWLRLLLAALLMQVRSVILMRLPLLLLALHIRTPLSHARRSVCMQTCGRERHLLRVRLPAELGLGRCALAAVVMLCLATLVSFALRLLQLGSGRPSTAERAASAELSDLLPYLPSLAASSVV